MPNMSYCMFTNTLEDLYDCYRELDSYMESKTEQESMIDLVKLCHKIAKECGDVWIEDAEEYLENME